MYLTGLEKNCNFGNRLETISTLKLLPGKVPPNGTARPTFTMDSPPLPPPEPGAGGEEKEGKGNSTEIPAAPETPPRVGPSDSVRSISKNITDYGSRALYVDGRALARERARERKRARERAREWSWSRACGAMRVSSAWVESVAVIVKLLTLCPRSI